MTAPEGWIEVKKLYRLWSAVPDVERLTPALVEEWVRNNDGGSGWTERISKKITQVLLKPSCRVAVVAERFGAGLWHPCQSPALSDGSGLCGRHGGRGSDSWKMTAAQLRAENARLRAELAAAGGES